MASAKNEALIRLTWKLLSSGGDYPLVGGIKIWWGGQGSGRLLLGFFQVEGMSKFLAGGGGTPPIPPQYGKPCMVTKIGRVVTYHKGLPL